MHRRRTDDPRVWIVVAGCVWELAALATGRLPTITQAVHRWRTHWVGRVIISVVLGELVLHLFEEGDHGR